MELNFAKEHSKPIIPLFVEPLEIHQRFKDYLGLDASSLQSFAEVIDQLMADLYRSIDRELPPADRDITILHLRELAKEEPNLAPIILGYLDLDGLHIDNADTVYSVAFHGLDDCLNALFDLYPREDMATCAAYGFSKAGAGTRALLSWIEHTGDGGLPLVTALGNKMLVSELIPTAIELLNKCKLPNNHALYSFIDKNITLLNEVQRRSIIRLVTWPVRADTTRLADTLAFVAFKHFPTSGEIRQMWIRWIYGGVFDGKPDNPEGLAHYLSQADEEQLPGWEPINQALRNHVHNYLRSGDKEKVSRAIDHVIAAANQTVPILALLLRETEGVSGTAEWNDWRKLDPDTAEFMGWLVHFTSQEASGDRDWVRVWDNTKKMVEFEKQRKQALREKNDDD